MHVIELGEHSIEEFTRSGVYTIAFFLEVHETFEVRLILGFLFFLLLDEVVDHHGHHGDGWALSG